MQFISRVEPSQGESIRLSIFKDFNQSHLSILVRAYSNEMVGKRKHIKDQLKHICAYTECKSAAGHKKLFLKSSSAEQRKFGNAVSECSKIMLDNGKQLQPGLQSRIRKHIIKSF